MRRIVFAAVTGSFAALIAPSALQAQEEAQLREADLVVRTRVTV